MSKIGNLGSHLYSGEVSYDIVGRRRRWYALSGVILLLALLGLGVRGLNLGIEFKGGAEFVIPASSCSVESARDAITGAGAQDPIVQQLGNGQIRAQTAELTAEQSASVLTNLSTACGVPRTDIKVQLVGSTWGGEITSKAIQGLLIFMVAVTIFLSIYFEWRMAVAALVALVHDLVITIGIYALVGFEVTPATVIGILTILGFSLYDTVVVFDKVKENTKGILGQSRMTYSEAANLAVNQTIVRSINTSIVALLPVASILFVGAGLLGAGTLKDLALALFVGTAAGTYSSIFVATPFMCQMKEKQPAIKALAARVAVRRAGLNKKEAQRAGRGQVEGSAVADGGEPAAGVAAGVGTAAVVHKERAHRTTGPRNQPKNTARSKRSKK
ncbi:MAG: protein translocase subunit SecF [Actinomycetes bacterium]